MSIGTASAIAVEHMSTTVQGMHTSIAESWLNRLGPIAGPAQAANEALLRMTYGSVRVAASRLTPVIDACVDENSREAGRTVAIAASLWGDTGDARFERLATTMSARDANGHLVYPWDRPLKMASPRLVVLIHGLSQADDCWAGTGGLLEHLVAIPDLTAITLRYNAAMPIASNGEHLDAMLTALTNRWPVPLESISLVGYSMGGVVAHHAVAAAESRDSPWLTHVDDVVSIGSPHGGSRIETAVATATMALRLARHTRPLADFFDSRSSGIKGLHTSMEVQDVSGASTRARYHFIAGGITQSPANPVSIIAGDLVVHPASAMGPAHLARASERLVGGVHHLALVRHPAVVSQVLTWLIDREGP
ncbi:MAG: esterase/lipase family protein [Acidimicrobiia bacterium]